MANCFSSECRMRIFSLTLENCFINWIVLIVVREILPWYLSFRALAIYRLREPFRCCFPTSHILSQLKVDDIASFQKFLYCTIPYASWLHHHVSINSQVHLTLSKSGDIQYHLDEILDNIFVIVNFCWSLLNGYILDVTSVFLCVIVHFCWSLLNGYILDVMSDFLCVIS
jgi:hypothetical protein